MGTSAVVCDGGVVSTTNHTVAGIAALPAGSTQLVVAVWLASTPVASAAQPDTAPAGVVVGKVTP